jgi:hypothetical protein
LVHLRHDIPDSAPKILVYFKAWKIHAGYFGMCGHGPVRRQDQQINNCKENRTKY